VHFAHAPDGRKWPLIEKGLLGAAALETLEACFDQAFAVGLERDGLHNSISFGHVARRDRRPVIDRAITAMLASPAGERLRWLLGDDLAFLVDNCSLRFHESGNDESRLRFHFDADFIGTTHLAVNVWVPLDPVGETSPGLTFLDPEVDGRPLVQIWQSKMRLAEDPSRPMHMVRFRDDFIDSALSAVSGKTLLTPVLAPGDAVLFNQFVLHSTQKMAGPHARRRSYEFRVAAAGAIPTFYANFEKPVQHWSWRDGAWTALD